ncbi:bifunctional folylpolyglutamate synthase/dihydrofolate synthase [bacterium]|nr:bifunctional folylpolyglutamate synthase/dihydrofolate synthase [bacterium]
MTKASGICSRQNAIAFLYSRIDYERISASLSASDFKLDRMRNLLQRIGNPHLKTPVVHVAGTKGKGSTAGMIAAGLNKAGYQVGLFTSPHIDQFEERVQINGEPIDEPLLVTLVEQLRSVAMQIDAEAGGLNPTFFELTTALAWLAFAARGVDIAVLEVGLGGRLDSTNLCHPVATVITTISRDHTHILGSRIEQIAHEKAGILKPEIPVISGVAAPLAVRVIEDAADRLHCRLLQIDREFGIDGTDGTRPVTFWKNDRRLSLSLTNRSRHQLRNAATACATLLTLNEAEWQISDESIRHGIETFRSNCRLQIICREPTILLDAAHNWASVGALSQTLSATSAEHRLLIFATSRDKDASGLLRRLLPQFHTVILTEYQTSPRATPLVDLAAIARTLSAQPVHVRKKTDHAVQTALSLCPADGLICIAGSFFLAAEVRSYLRDHPCLTTAVN